MLGSSPGVSGRARGADAGTSMPEPGPGGPGRVRDGNRFFTLLRQDRAMPEAMVGIRPPARTRPRARIPRIAWTSLRISGKGCRGVKRTRAGSSRRSRLAGRHPPGPGCAGRSGGARSRSGGWSRMTCGVPVPDLVGAGGTRGRPSTSSCSRLRFARCRRSWWRSVRPHQSRSSRGIEGSHGPRPRCREDAAGTSTGYAPVEPGHGNPSGSGLVVGGLVPGGGGC